MRVGSLFSGIGGFDLGLERAGFEIAWQVENNDYCRRVLKKHWPAVPCHYDIKTIDWRNIPPVDLVCGGFPCQDISNLHQYGKGIGGPQSGLWREFERCIRILKPSWVLIENVASLRKKGLGEVIGDHWALGYDAEWHCIPACAVGAPHVRDRIWIMAYSDGKRQQACLSERNFRASFPQRKAMESSRPSYGDFPAWNPTEPNVGRVAHGVSHRVDRLRGLGNAVVPQVVEAWGRIVKEAR